jgi:DNA-binding response OmpR family regulator
MDETQRKKIFVIDDDPAVCELIYKTLKAEGCEVICVTSSENILDKARAVKPHLIFISLVLTESNGLKISRSIRLEEAVKAVPIFLMVSSSDEFNRNYASFAGINDVLLKPVTSDTILSKTLNMLGEETVSSEKEPAPHVTPADEEPATLPEQEIPDESERDKHEAIGAGGLLLGSSEEKIPEHTEEQFDEARLEADEDVSAEQEKGLKNKLPFLYILVGALAIFGILTFLFSDRGGEMERGTTPEKESPANETLLKDSEEQELTGDMPDKTKAMPSRPAEAQDKKQRKAESLLSKKPTAVTQTIYSVQVGAFENKANAVSFKERLLKKGYEAYIRAVKRNNRKTLHKVLVGEFDTISEAMKQSRIIRQKEAISSFVYQFKEQ